MRQLTASVVTALVTVASLAGCGAQGASLTAAAPQGQVQASKMSPDAIKLERIRALVGSWAMAYVTRHYRGEQPTVELKSLSVRAAAAPATGYRFTAKVFYQDGATAGHVQVKGRYDNVNRKYSEVEFKELDIDHQAKR